jgi:hypothetical protein
MVIELIPGWWFQPTPLKKIKTVVSWDYYPQLNGKIKFMFQTTNQIPLIPCLGFQGIQRDNLFQRLPPNLTTTSIFWGVAVYAPFNTTGNQENKKTAWAWLINGVCFGSMVGHVDVFLYWSIHFTAQ